MWVDGKDTKDVEELWNIGTECRHGISKSKPDHWCTVVEVM